MNEFITDFNEANIVQGYNLSFDYNVIIAELNRLNSQDRFNMNFNISNIKYTI